MAHGSALFVVLFGIVVISFSAFAIVNPDFMRRAVGYWVTPARLAVATALRLSLGAALLIVAVDARLPAVARGLGVLTIFGGLIIPVLGVQRIEALAERRIAGSDLSQRVWGAIAGAIGALMIYAVT
jgi:hypothetical protein